MPDYPAPCLNFFFFNSINFSIFLFFYLQNLIAVFVFSDSRCKHACNCLQICAHVFINRPQNCTKTSFHSRERIVTEFWSFTRKSDLVIRALNCARFCVVCALNCARILVVRALDCAQFFCTLPFSQASCNTTCVWRQIQRFDPSNHRSSRTRIRDRDTIVLSWRLSWK